MTKQNYPASGTPPAAGAAAPAAPDPTPAVVWRRPDGEVITCADKIAVLAENLAEIEEVCREALGDALVMEVDEGQFRQVLADLVQRLPAPYAGR